MPFRTASQRQSSFLQETLPGGSIRCPLSAGPGGHPSLLPTRFPNHPTDTHTLRSGAKGWTRVPVVPERLRERIPEVGSKGGGTTPPSSSSLLQGGRNETSRIHRAPTLLAHHLGLPVWEWGFQAENTALSPSLRALSPQRG